MNAFRPVFLLGIGWLAACGFASGPDALHDGFVMPPASARPHVWWHWMNGNVSKAGITADLEAMAEAGIGGAQVFDVSDGIPPGSVAFNTDAWFDMLRHANAEAKRLGIELCLANCSGWSSSGGPWVRPEDAEKDVVFAETVVKGGVPFRGLLPRPPNPHGFYRDVAVLAFPRPEAERIDARDYGVRQAVTDGLAEIAFDRPYPLTGVALRFKGGGRHVIAHVTIAVSNGGVLHELVKSAEVYPMRYGFEDDRIFVPIGPCPVVRLQVRCELTAGASLVSAEPEARGRIAEERAKTFFIRSRLAGLENAAGRELAIPRGEIRDITSSMNPDGRLDWTPPASSDEWVVVRVGCAANGTRCRPATANGDGLEVDKFSKAALRRYLTEGYVGRAVRELGPVSHQGGLRALIVDSFEVKSQNWTEGLEDVFRQKKGYDLLPWLVAFTGRLVDSVGETDRVLSDFREVASGLFVENYAEEFRRYCHENGLELYLEGYGGAPCDDLSYARHCDLPMGEFWARDRMKTGNCRFAASVAHVWGQRIVAAESFTSGPEERWNCDPFAYKAQGDRAYCAGVNRIIYHRWAHQPWTGAANFPGMTMGPHGSHFERTQTWWKDAAPAWLKYQARCQWMLQQGMVANDVLVVAEGKKPSCGLDLTRWHEYEQVEADRFGRGLGWDVCSPAAADASVVRNGRVVAPSGAEYLAVVRLPDGRLPKLEPDVDCADRKVYECLRWIHRRAGDDEIYFVALPNEEETSFEVSFRQSDKIPEVWDPEYGSVREPVEVRKSDGRTFVRLDFKPSGAAFVVFRAVPTEGLAKQLRMEFDSARAEDIVGAWSVCFHDGRGAPETNVVFGALKPWNVRTEDGIRHYSGSATYAKVVSAPKHEKDERVVLDLGEVKNVAVVTVNGRTYPCLWRPPYRLDVTDALADGSLDLSVRVTNLWPNRLIGDERFPCDAAYGADGGIVSIPRRVWRGEASPCGRKSFSTWRLWRKDEPLLASGLIGPVRILTYGSKQERRK